ncbi:acetyl-CoA carboxylase carboxyltransferase subunit alpha [Alphaproteobacteria bacterium]|nr:acetyl-CoA carboxylase carboxyltransferase subunit alpha [Alphaproteobacteria bacterium]
MIKYFDFEKPIEEIDLKINNLESKKGQTNNNKVEYYKKEKDKILKKIYTNLNAWQKVQIARHPNRPHCLDYINAIFNNFISLAGDKKFGEDRSIIGGIGKIEDQSYMIIGTEKGNSMESRIKHNFGMAKPEGYRKSQRLMLLSEKLNLPIITLVDTAGAFPGKEAEERGQSESIASSIAVSLKVSVPVISIIIGEGGSGGAIALATADKVIMLENSIYSVISPEGCSSILWKSTEFVQKAAESLKLTAQDCLKFGIIDEIAKEMHGGAHRYPSEQYKLIKNIILDNSKTLKEISATNLLKNRNNKYLNITQNY